MAFLYTWPSEQHTAVSTFAATSSYPAYPPANAALLDPSMPVKMDVPGYLMGDTGTPASVGFFALIGHNLPVGAVVRFETSASPGFAPLVTSSALTIRPMRADGMPVNPWIRLPGTASARYWRVIVDSSPVSPVMLGVPWFGPSVHALRRGLAWDSSRTRTRLASVHRTEGGARLGYDYGLTLRKLRGQTTASYVPGLPDERRELERWWDACRGSLRPMVIVPDDSDPEDGAWFVTFDGLTHDHTRQRGQQAAFPLAFEEVPQGVWVIP